jgi:hypothetical protein
MRNKGSRKHTGKRSRRPLVRQSRDEPGRKHGEIGPSHRPPESITSLISEWEPTIYSEDEIRPFNELQRHLESCSYTAPLFNCLVAGGVPAEDLTALLCRLVQFGQQPTHPRRKGKRDLLEPRAFRALKRQQKMMAGLAVAHRGGIVARAYQDAAIALGKPLTHFQEFSGAMQSNGDRAFLALVHTVRRNSGGRPRDPEVADLLEQTALALFRQLGKEESTPEYSFRKVTTLRRRLEKLAIVPTKTHHA